MPSCALPSAVFRRMFSELQHDASVLELDEVSLAVARVLFACSCDPSLKGTYRSVDSLPFLQNPQRNRPQQSARQQR